MGFLNCEASKATTNLQDHKCNWIQFSEIFISTFFEIKKCIQDNFSSYNSYVEHSLFDLNSA